MSIIPNPNKKIALFLIDIQAGFVNNENRWIIPNIQNAIQFGGYHLIIETIFHADNKSLWGKQVHWTFRLQPTIPEIKKLLDKSSTTIIKTTKSAFKGNNDIFSILKHNAIEEVHITGLDTNDCVLATALESFDLGFRTFVLEECTASSDGSELRECALKILRNSMMTDLVH